MEHMHQDYNKTSIKIVEKEIKLGLRQPKTGFASTLKKSDTLDQLQKKLAAAKKKVEELTKQEYPDQDKIERAEVIVARLQETLRKEGR